MKRVLLILALCANLSACGRTESVAQPAEQAQSAEQGQSAEPSQPIENADSPQLAAAVAQIEALKKAGKYDEALRAVADAEAAHGRSERLSEIFESIYNLAPQFNAPPRHLLTDQDVSAVKKLGGGSSLVYRLIKDKKTFAAFKPRQKRKQSNPRAEIAAYRLCPLIRCRFDIPQNDAVWFDYKQFSGLYARLPSNPQNELTDLDLVKEAGVDRVEGTMKAWVHEFAEFPIEIDKLWKPWFEMSREELKKTPASEAVAAVSQTSKRASAISAKLTAQMNGVSAYDVALQLSNMIVFDYLTNNWDRFSTKEEFYGVNCQFANGRFISIDNGASFPQTANPIPAEKFHALTRFSKLTYDSIVALDKAKTLERLFPDATPREVERFEKFWEQRASYIDFVNKLVAEKGAENVFFFE